MAFTKKNDQELLKKLGIEELNSMQVEARQTIVNHSDVILLSPTGTGKTVAFLLAILDQINPSSKNVQVLILVPSRELAIQTEQVFREMGSGYKANAIYGGRNISKDKDDLRTPPAILIGTPGRIADHFRRGTVPTDGIEFLILDEFDKSLEVGFAKDMKEIISDLWGLRKRILTSATQQVEIPNFVRLKNAKTLNFLDVLNQKLALGIVPSTQKDKLKTLVNLVMHIGNKNGIVFCNFKSDIEGIHTHLSDLQIDHVCFFGGMEQVDRERALIKFRNGTHRLLIATDLAARGIDVPAMDFIIHYDLPLYEEEFIHRNGRTARMHEEGFAYIITTDKVTRDYIQGIQEVQISPKREKLKKEWQTLFISGGRKDKISKGDIAGLFFKQGKLNSNELGLIELKQDCAFVAVPFQKARGLAEKLNNSRLKKKKVRIRIL